VSSYHYICPHTTIYVLIQLCVCPYTSICVLIQLHVHRCPHTTTYFSSCYYMTLCVSSLYLAPRSPSMCPHSTRRSILILLRVSSAPLSCSMSVLILLFLYPHTTICHLAPLSRSNIGVPHTTIYVSSYYFMCHLAPRSRSMCPHTTTCVLIRPHVIYVSCLSNHRCVRSQVCND